MDEEMALVGAGTIGTAAQAKAGKYLTFQLAQEAFGLEILKVQEIIGLMNVTKVPRAPAFVRGVINLRGRIIPVVDLRQKFGLESVTDTERTCIVVVQVARERARLTLGIVVDEVSEVLNVLEEQIESAPDFGTQVDTEFILGIGKVGGKVVMLLDVDKVLGGSEVDVVEQIAE